MRDELGQAALVQVCAADNDEHERHTIMRNELRLLFHSSSLVASAKRLGHFDEAALEALDELEVMVMHSEFPKYAERASAIICDARRSLSL